MFQKIFGLTLSLFFLLLFCSKSRIFTDVTVEVKSLDELFPAEFYGERVELTRDKRERSFAAKEHILGIYGSRVSLEVWDFSDSAKAKEIWENLVKEKRLEKLKSFTVDKTTENRFDYETEENFSGIIFTNKGFLFAVEAASPKILSQFIQESKIGRVG